MKRESTIYKIIRATIIIFSIGFVLVPMIPVIFMAFKTGRELKTTGYFTPPNSFLNFYNFVYAMRVGELGQGLITTFIILFITLAFVLMFSGMAAYALGRFDFKLKKLITGMFTMTMFIPVVTTQVVIFQMMHKLGLVNSIWSVIIIYSGVSIVDLYILMNLLAAIPREMEEAALVDGANMFQTYFRIIFPLMKPGLATIGVIRGIGIYNDFYVPNLYLLSGRQTLTVALYKFYSGLSTPFEVVSAAVLIATVPVIIMFLLFQKHIYDGLGGAVKS
ncbi:MAG: carbohydrate ABC transporter permease [Lachnotalea sp.]